MLCSNMEANQVDSQTEKCVNHKNNSGMLRSPQHRQESHIFMPACIECAGLADTLLVIYMCTQIHLVVTTLQSAHLSQRNVKYAALESREGRQ